jgi:hypothetical protein
MDCLFFHDYPPESETSAWKGYPNDTYNSCMKCARCRRRGCERVKYIGQHDYEEIGSRAGGYPSDRFVNRINILRCRKCGDTYEQAYAHAR